MSVFIYTNLAYKTNYSNFFFYQKCIKYLHYVFRHFSILTNFNADVPNALVLNTSPVRIEKLVNTSLNTDDNKQDEIITNSTGQVIATWKKGGIFFEKNIDFDRKKFNELVLQFFS